MGISKSETVLVTGATGAIGHRVVHALCRSGYGVRTFSLDTPEPKLFPPEVDNHIGDVTDPMAVDAAMQGIDAVIHLAALLHNISPSPELHEKYERINVSGTATVVDAAVKACVKRIILASTIAVYGPSGGKILNEESFTRPDTIYAGTKLSAEKIILNARSTEGFPLGTVLRFGAVYGSRIRGNYQRLVKALAQGRFIAIGDGSNRRSLVYDKDLAQAVVLAIADPAAAGQIFNVTDGSFHTLKEIIAAINLALGRKPPRLSLPIGPIRFAISILENGAGLVGLKSPVMRATIDKYTEDIAVDSQRIQTTLGFVPKYDLAAGWLETVKEMRQSGDL